MPKCCEWGRTKAFVGSSSRFRRRLTPPSRTTGSSSDRATTRSCPEPRAEGRGPMSPAGVLITKPRLYIRGMNRNAVVVDGTKPGSRDVQQQGIRPGVRSHPQRHRVGLNGLLVWKADNVWIQNLTACNYLHGSGDTGNEIWWNGGTTRSKGRIGGSRVRRLLPERHEHVLQEREDRCPVRDLLEQLERRHLGADVREQLQRLRLLHRRLQAACNQVVDQHRTPQFNVLGYSGSNSGGTLVVKNSEFDQQPGRLRHQQPERRQPGTAERRLPEGHQPAGSRARRTRAGCS